MAGSVPAPRRSHLHASYRTGWARNAGESQYPELWKSLIGAWCPALGSSGLKLMDLSGRGNDGTLTSMDPNTDWMVDQHGQQLDFDGTDDSVELGTPESLKPTTQITIAAWVVLKATPNSSGMRVISKSNGGTGDNWALILLANLKARLRINGSNNDSGGTLNMNEMNFVCASYDGKQARVYVNGIRSTEAETNAIPTTNPVSIGRNPSSSIRFLEGSLASVMVWDTGIHDGAVFELDRMGPAGFWTPKPRPFKVGVAAPAGTVPAFMYNYRKRRVA